MWLCLSSHPEVEFISPPFESGHGHDTYFGQWDITNVRKGLKSACTWVCFVWVVVATLRPYVNKPKLASWNSYGEGNKVIQDRLVSCPFELLYDFTCMADPGETRRTAQ